MARVLYKDTKSNQNYTIVVVGLLTCAEEPFLRKGRGRRKGKKKGGRREKKEAPLKKRDRGRGEPLRGGPPEGGEKGGGGGGGFQRGRGGKRKKGRGKRVP
ncbi:hypothetical protein, partial [Escherichia coli]|uniref:hypothetical protein n=1 Tax=Escherichia coli TaxID=562 RepID=UPI00141B550B